MFLLTLAKLIFIKHFKKCLTHRHLLSVNLINGGYYFFLQYQAETMSKVIWIISTFSFQVQYINKPLYYCYPNIYKLDISPILQKVDSRPTMITSLAQSSQPVTDGCSVTQIVDTFESQGFAFLLIQIPEANDSSLGFLIVNSCKFFS